MAIPKYTKPAIDLVNALMVAYPWPAWSGGDLVYYKGSLSRWKFDSNAIFFEITAMYRYRPSVASIVELVKRTVITGAERTVQGDVRKTIDAYARYGRDWSKVRAAIGPFLFNWSYTAGVCDIVASGKIRLEVITQLERNLSWYMSSITVQHIAAESPDALRAKAMEVGAAKEVKREAAPPNTWRRRWAGTIDLIDTQLLLTTERSGLPGYVNKDMVALPEGFKVCGLGAYGLTHAPKLKLDVLVVKPEADDELEYYTIDNRAKKAISVLIENKVST